VNNFVQFLDCGLKVFRFKGVKNCPNVNNFRRGLDGQCPTPPCDDGRVKEKKEIGNEERTFGLIVILGAAARRRKGKGFAVYFPVDSTTTKTEARQEAATDKKEKLNMKRFTNLGLVLAVAGVAALAQSAGAQEITNTVPITANPASPLQGMLDGFAGKYGWVATVVLVIGTLRILLKPVMAAIENAVANDPGRTAALQKFEAGPVFKAISFVLDLGASIKLPQTVVAATVPKSN
jgi:hypothetical protein